MQYNSYDYNFDCNNNYKPFKSKLCGKIIIYLLKIVRINNILFLHRVIVLIFMFIII